MAITQERQRSEKRRMTEVFPVRMTKAERAELEQLARAFNTSIGALLRESALARAKEAPPLLPVSA